MAIILKIVTKTAGIFLNSHKLAAFINSKYVENHLYKVVN